MKVVKFGGSSMADAGQYRKIREILMADPERRVVVVSAAGKRFSGDHKITDLLYLCHAHTQYGVDCSNIFEMIRSRYLEIRDELGIKLDLESEFSALKSGLDRKMVSQGYRIDQIAQLLPVGLSSFGDRSAVGLALSLYQGLEEERGSQRP